MNRRGTRANVLENAINETVHLLSVPGMRESILEGMQDSTDSAATEL